MRSGAEGERPAAAASTPEKSRPETFWRSVCAGGPGSGEDGAGAASVLSMNHSIRPPNGYEYLKS